MSASVGKQIGDFIGMFVDYDPGNNTGLWRSYMRIRVLIDVQLPLKRWKRIKRPQGDWSAVNF